MEIKKKENHVAEGLAESSYDQAEEFDKYVAIYDEPWESDQDFFVSGEIDTEDAPCDQELYPASYLEVFVASFLDSCPEEFGEINLEDFLENFYAQHPVVPLVFKYPA